MRQGLIAAGILIVVLVFGGSSVAYEAGRGGWHMGGYHMGQGMGPGTGMMGPSMMGPMMGSPEVMGTMMSIHGEIMSLMGEMMQKYGRAGEQMTPELREQMQREVIGRMGDILTKHGTALKERAKAPRK